MAYSSHPDGLSRSVDDHTPTSVCVIVVLYDNPLSQLWRCLRALQRTVELAIADWRLSPSVVRISLGDCSDTPLVHDHDLKELREGMHPRITVSYQWFGQNLGHSAGCNTLADGSVEDSILFLNPDTYLAPRSFAYLLQGLHQPDVFATDARQIPCEHPKWYDPMFGDQSWASGSCLLVRGSRFHEVSGFDAATFPSYTNDVDLSWRLRLHGGRVVHQPRAVVFHDKRLNESGSVIPTATEPYQSVLGRLLLATKYARDDVVEDTLALVDSNGGYQQRRALREFRRRSEHKELPDQIRGAHTVAEFVEGDYGNRQH